MAGEAAELQTSVGCITTLPSQALREDIDIRASHEQKVQEALCTPQSAPDSKHGRDHTNPRATIHHPTHSNNNTTTWLTPASNVQCDPSPPCATRMHQPQHMYVMVGCKRHPMPNICICVTLPPIPHKQMSWCTPVPKIKSIICGIIWHHYHTRLVSGQLSTHMSMPLYAPLHVNCD